MIKNTRRSLVKNYTGKRIEKDERFIYESRLAKTYKKKDEKRCFLDQLINGSGNELKDKFWSKISSSRLAFDIYSWLAEDLSCIDIQLEYKMPGIISKGRECKANMDVMIETENDIWFIESKFTETANNGEYENNLPEAYWKDYEINDHPNCYKKADGKGYVYGYPILKRFGNQELMASTFQKFCVEISKESKTAGVDWFDAKQETCHLFGILKFMLENELGKTKTVHFANIIYHFENEEESKFSENFRKKAIKMSKQVTGKELDYRIDYVQNVIQKFGGRKAFGSDMTVQQLFNTYPKM